MTKLQLVTIIALVAAVLATGSGAFYFANMYRELPSPDQFGARQVNQSTKLYDRTGQTLLYEIHGEEKRTIVALDKIPEYLQQAVIAAEDANFYNRAAFDWKAILRAAFVNLKERRIVQGGSTITQQLARNVFLTREKTLDRKLRELVLAIEIESKYSKEEILVLYLNQIPFGSNAYGVEAASQIYFKKPVDEVALKEAAVLAAMIRAPSYYSPWGENREALLGRAGRVLARMVELGMVSEEDRESADEKELVFAERTIGQIRAPHFSLAVRDQLVAKYGEEKVFGGGLKVITSLDFDLQRIAERVIKEGTAGNAAAYGSNNAAMVVQDPKTGEVLALVGSKDYFAPPEPAGCVPGLNCKFEGNFNVVVQGLRQPGSALKPFVYLTAFQKGYPPETIVYDVPTEFDLRGGPETSYKPRNFDGRYRGPVSFKDALGQSLNLPAVKILYLAGFDDVLSNLHNFGITTLRERWRYGLSLTLGSGEVKLIDLVNAYATLSQNGVFRGQTMILEVQDHRGSVLDKYSAETKRVAEPQEARLVNSILADPALRAPIFGRTLAQTIFPGYDVALKTGTSDDHKDAWTVGYTPNLVVGVWAGNNDGSLMINQPGSIMAAVPVWNAFMKEALPRFSPEPFPRPALVPPVAKPMLNGEAEFHPVVDGATYPQIHSILYYVDRKDPLGPPPRSVNDPQFPNWESAVLVWAAQNVPGFGAAYNKSLPREVSFTTPSAAIGGSRVDISEVSPSQGDFVKLPLTVKATLRARDGLALAQLRLNGAPVDVQNITGTEYPYSFVIYGLAPQNLIELKAISVRGEEASVNFVVFYDNGR